MPKIIKRTIEVIDLTGEEDAVDNTVIDLTGEELPTKCPTPPPLRIFKRKYPLNEKNTRVTILDDILLPVSLDWAKVFDNVNVPDSGEEEDSGEDSVDGEYCLINTNEFAEEAEDMANWD